MVLWNGNPRKICYLDTCIISEMLESMELVQQLISRGYVFAISQFTLYEQLDNITYYYKVLDLLENLPVVISKHFDQLIDIEIECFYKNSINVLDIFIGYGTLLNPKARIATRNFLESKEFLDKALEFNLSKVDILNSFLKLKDNFVPRENITNYKNANEFVYHATLERITRKNPLFMSKLMETTQKTLEWEKHNTNHSLPDDIEKLVRMGRLPDLFKFVSWNMPLFLVYYKFYIDYKKPIVSDVADLAMSSIYPYCDVIIVEKNQAEKVKQIKSKHSIMNKTDIIKYNGKELVEV
jgi:hypothetical protein